MFVHGHGGSCAFYLMFMLVHAHVMSYPSWFLRMVYVHIHMFSWCFYPCYFWSKRLMYTHCFHFQLGLRLRGRVFCEHVPVCWFPGARSMCKWGCTIAIWFAPMILEIAARLGLEGFVADFVLDHFYLQFTGFKNIPSPGFSLGNGCFVGVLLRKAPSRHMLYACRKTNCPGLDPSDLESRDLARSLHPLRGCPRPRPRCPLSEASVDKIAKPACPRPLLWRGWFCTGCSFFWWSILWVQSCSESTCRVEWRYTKRVKKSRPNFSQRWWSWQPREP